MKLSNRQMEGFHTRCQEEFVEYMVRFLRQEVPEVVGKASREELDAFIRGGRERAGQYDITESYLVQQYILFMCRVGEDLHEQSWAAPILNDAERSAAQKIFDLEDYMMTEWEGSR
ncbi:MAG: hypothetical protein ACYTHJ_06750 [Planctomycetota bacterium]|jgi:hypothetical protein